MSGKIRKCCLLHEEKTWTPSRVLRSLNRLPNVNYKTFFNVRPPPKFCLINLFMSSLSPAVLIVVMMIIMMIMIKSSLLEDLLVALLLGFLNVCIPAVVRGGIFPLTRRQ